MFRGLKGRRVVVTYEGGEDFSGRVGRVGILSLTLSSFSVIDSAGARPAEGSARLRRRRITWLQVLPETEAS